MTQETMNQSDFAKHLGKDKSYVTRLKQSGRLVLVAGGLVDVEKSKALIAQTADPSRATSSEPPVAEVKEPAAGGTYHTAKAMNEQYKALTAKLEYEKASEKLVDADAVRLFAADIGATFRSALEILPDRISSELVALSDVDAIRAVLVDAFEQVLLDLSHKIEKGIA